MFIDIHTHLPQYNEEELSGIINRWRSNNVKFVVSVGTTIEDSRKSIDLSNNHYDVLSGIGLHPSDLTSELACFVDLVCVRETLCLCRRQLACL